MDATGAVRLCGRMDGERVVDEVDANEVDVLLLDENVAAIQVRS